MAKLPALKPGETAYCIISLAVPVPEGMSDEEEVYQYIVDRLRATGLNCCSPMPVRS